MIKYEDVIRQISILEKRKSKNEEKIKQLSKDNETVLSNLKILNSKKEIFEKMNNDLSYLIPDKKKASDLKRPEVSLEDRN